MPTEESQTQPRLIKVTPVDAGNPWQFRWTMDIPVCADELRNQSSPTFDRMIREIALAIKETLKLADERKLPKKRNP